MLRGFKDSTGVEWRVWEVLPSTWGQNSRSFAGSSLKETPFANGWLCFESSREKRRLAPIPDGWDRREPATLEELCRLAAPVHPKRGTATVVA